MNELLNTRIQRTLTDVRAKKLERKRRVVTGVKGPHIAADDRLFLNFSSSDYLGLSQHHVLQNHLGEVTKRFGLGTCASQMVSGYTNLQHDLEAELARFLGFERTLLFGSGYLACQGLLASVLIPPDIAFIDRLAHASLYDGLAIGNHDFCRFHHNNMKHLKKLLQENPTSLPYVITDGVFSMDGDLAPLPEMVEVARETQAVLIIDDAHGLGVLGEHGRGILEHYGLTSKEVPVLVGSLSKSLGCYGGFVASSEPFIEYLIQKSRSARYSTALPGVVIACALQSLHLQLEEPWRIKQLNEMIAYFQKRATEAELPVLPSLTPIQSILFPGIKELMEAAEALWERNMWVGVMRPPTVPANKLRIRISLTALHEEQHIDSLIDALVEIVHAQEKCISD